MMSLRVLAIQLKRIGDVIQTVPAVSVLREVRPDAEVTILVECGSAGLIPMIPGVRGFARGTPGFWEWLRSSYDVCLDFSGTDRSALYAALSRAGRRITFQRFRKRWAQRLTCNVFVESSVRERHTADHFVDLLSGMGVHGQSSPLRLDVPPLSREIARLLPEAPYAVIHAGAARAEKFWPPERWAAVARTLFERFRLEVVLTGSRSAAEQSHIQEIRRSLSSVPAWDLSGATTLPELAGVIRGAAIFCGVDTAAMHLADAVGTPCVALFGPTNPFHWAPRQSRSVVLRAGVSAPFLPCQKGVPLDALPAEEVIASAASLLTQKAPA